MVGALPHKNAIVTLCVGDEYVRLWGHLCKRGWELYAAQNNFDLIVLSQPLDDSERGRARSPAWQKLLILDQDWAQNYEQIVWIDADILIAPHSPNILDYVPDPRRIGICIVADQLSSAQKHVYLERLYKQRIAAESAEAVWLLHNNSPFERDGIDVKDCKMLSTGVMVLSPCHHRQLFRECYSKEGTTQLYEQPALSYVIWHSGLMQSLSPRFNWTVHEAMTLYFNRVPQLPLLDGEMANIHTFVENEYEKAYFLHFAGSMPLMKLVAFNSPHTLIHSWQRADHLGNAGRS
jgi:hypothetical protein